MLFNNFVFLFAFLPITYALFWALRFTQARDVWLTVTGYVFYGYWDPRFCPLMAFSRLVSYTAGIGMMRWPDRKTLFLVVPIVADLAVLAFFRCTNFALDTALTVVTSSTPRSPSRISTLS